MTAPLPVNEDQRLAALHSYAVLDSPPEAAIDRLTELAAKLFNVPMALVSLIDRDRQWFKSRIGVDAPETHRDFAFCAHAILQEEPMIVPDSTRDLRFCDNPLVTGALGVRFYAGVPIRTTEGHALGTLCVIDSAPRNSWAKSETDLLKQLGAIVMDELQLRVETRKVIDLSRSLEHRAHHDSLTGLPNRFHFETELAKAIGRSTAKRRVAILFIDLDEFKIINDSFGHHIGDRFLMDIADRFREAVGPRGLLARLGGDEFTVLLENVESAEEPGHLAEALLRSLKPAISIEALQLFATASIGISVGPEDGADSITLMRNADIAMYSAKNSGPNQIQFASRDISDQVTRLRTIQSYLYEALAEKRFRLHYQPQYKINGELSGVEALLRLEHPDLGPLSPAEFIPIAESNGLIIEIGDWVLSDACREASEWASLGKPVRVAVNVSPLQLKQPDFNARIAEVLRKTGLSAELLELEITETAVMTNIDQCQQALRKIGTLGVSIAMDDFGTGYSSIRYLQQLPVQRIKIDRSFIQDLLSTSSPSLELVRGIIVIAHAIGIKVVAEGIENQEQLETLQRLDCDFAQGYLLSRPIPSYDLVGLLNGSMIRPAICPFVRYAPNLNITDAVRN